MVAKRVFKNQPVALDLTDAGITYAAVAAREPGRAFSAGLWFSIPTGETIEDNDTLLSSDITANADTDAWYIRLNVSGPSILARATIKDSAVITTKTQSTATILADGVWHFVGFVYDGAISTAASRLNLIVNGVAVSQTAGGTISDLGASNSIPGGVSVGSTQDDQNKAPILFGGGFVVNKALTTAQMFSAMRILKRPDRDLAKRALFHGGDLSWLVVGSAPFKAPRRAGAEYAYDELFKDLVHGTAPAAASGTPPVVFTNGYYLRNV
ncbi:MAG: LamG domain-containing protein [Myxococcales bacterium]|nr:LamG domain-containing protein [Myxococcales bacterium]